MSVKNILLYCAVASILSHDFVVADGFCIGVDVGAVFHDVSFDGNGVSADRYDIDLDGNGPLEKVKMLISFNKPFNDGKSTNVTKASAAAQGRCGYYWGSDVRFAVDAIAEWMPVSKKVSYAKIKAAETDIDKEMFNRSQLKFKNGFGGGLGIKVSKDFGVHRIGLGVDVVANNYSFTESYCYLAKTFYNNVTEKDFETKTNKASKTLIFVSPNVSYEYTVAKNYGVTLGYAYRFGSKLSAQYTKKTIANYDSNNNVSIRPTAHVFTVGARYYIYK